MVMSLECCENREGHHVAHELKVDGLCASYGKTAALREVSFSVNCGTRMALVGPNGSGKSTLLKVLAGLLIPDHGQIEWRGKRLTSSSHEIAYLPQRERLDWGFPITVRGVVEMGRYPHTGAFKGFNKKDCKVVDSALETMGLIDLGNRQIAELSGGQQQRTFLARALAQEAHVLLLDEPLNGLDEETRGELKKVFEELARHGHLILASHHDFSSLEYVFDKVLVLDTAQVYFGGTKEAELASILKGGR